ncbi:hypothetical protein JCM3766R1_005914 [Sporobolomyces carnicolor]
MTHFSGTSPPMPMPMPMPTPRTRTRTLKKKSSLADLAKKHLRRFKGRGDFDFGCQGDALDERSESGEDEDEDEVSAAVASPSTSNAAAAAAAPSRPQQPADVLDESQFSHDELRALRRQHEEALAASACLEYIHTHRRQHSRTHSRTSSANLASLNLHDRDATVVVPSSSSSSSPRLSRSIPHHVRSESNSSLQSHYSSLSLSSSGGSSSRPRTNDSLPSFASSDAPTMASSIASHPPSPVQHNTSRPTLFLAATAAAKLRATSSDSSDSNNNKIESVIDPALQPRAYAFI